MKEYLIETVKLDDLNGIQKIYKFKNGLGASVVKHNMSYGHKAGLWEIAPWDEAHNFIGVTMLEWLDDVKGYLNDPEVDKILRQVKELV